MHPIFGSLDGPEEPLPPLLLASAVAAHCYTFTGGRLEHLPLYHALHGLDDWELTTELLAVIGAAAPPRLL